MLERYDLTVFGFNFSFNKHQKTKDLIASIGTGQTMGTFLVSERKINNFFQPELYLAHDALARAADTSVKIFSSSIKNYRFQAAD